MEHQRLRRFISVPALYIGIADTDKMLCTSHSIRLPLINAFFPRRQLDQFFFKILQGFFIRIQHIQCVIEVRLIITTGIAFKSAGDLEFTK